MLKRFLGLDSPDSQKEKEMPWESIWIVGEAKEKKSAAMGDDDLAPVGKKSVVLKLDFLGESDENKVMKAVSSLSGVDSMSLDMEEKKLTVTGNVDATKLVLMLKKKWRADVESVGPGKKPYKKEQEEDGKKKDYGDKKDDKLSPAVEITEMSCSSSSQFSAEKKFDYDASDRKRFKYDVFLSFRREAARDCFTDHLYAALLREKITAFRDDVRLESGETVSGQLVKAIEGSRLAIVVLSRNYISSSWCLEELVKVLECQKEMGLVVAPIFYDVHPSDVRHIKGDVREAFDRFRDKGVDAVKLQRWKNALMMVVDFTGRASTYCHEAELVESIVDDISSRLRHGHESKLAGKALMKEDAGKHLGDLEMSLAKDHIIGISLS